MFGTAETNTPTEDSNAGPGLAPCCVIGRGDAESGT